METLADPELLISLQPTWEVQPGISTFPLTAQRRARAMLAALDPADLHRRMLTHGVTESALPEMLTHFRLPLTGTVGESREPGWSVFYETFSEEHGFLVWSIYSPGPDPQEALDRFRQFFFQGQPDSEAFRAAVIVLPGFFSHPGAAPGQGRELEIMPSRTAALGDSSPERRLVSTDTPTPLSDKAASVSFFTHWTRLSLPPDDLLWLFEGDLPVPPAASSLQEITAALRSTFRLGVDEVARLLGTSRLLALRRDPPSLEVLDRLYALGGVLDILAAEGTETAVAWLTQPLPVLAWSRPIDLCHTRYGLARVSNVVQRLHDGMLS
ncbi:antitoxin Xre/MbcA/ParS toxin-binding domain-containing protein [Deinococcus altitudinis]|uniref:antitoxin Xre/MbcA/ParS toxin-binding domain-containing protein n=1 Tax=Deinococcus altitudinis TaxID=468914 RepID=UPI00389210E6